MDLTQRSKKYMKKAIYIAVIFAFSMAMVMPAVAVEDSVTVGAGLNRGAGGGADPIVKVKWEMKGPCFDPTSGLYNKCTGVTGGEAQDDDKLTPYAQFMAPGFWDGKMHYTVCAIATDPNGAADIKGVYADIYYPADKAIHDMTPSTDVHRDLNGGTKDVGVGGCSAFIEQNTLKKLSKTDGYLLFCEQVRENNVNLPKFYSPYTYDEICAPDGELMKQEAYVYCSDKELIWEDPAGSYKVDVVAQDNAGNNSTKRTNNFEYLPSTGFEKDFTGVTYGQVMLGIYKRISGDLTWANGVPTIRNTGNTRLWMKIAQDDMGLGQSSGLWNVHYDARVGSYEADETNYDPFGFKPATPASGAYTQLEDILDLSEKEEMDFSIIVDKWPDAQTSYSGTIWLKASPAPFRICFGG